MSIESFLDVTLPNDAEIRVVILGGSSFTDITVDLVMNVCLNRFKEENRNVKIEMWRVRFCDSPGLSMLLKLQKEIGRQGFKLILEIGDRAFWGFLRVMKIDEFIEIRLVSADGLKVEIEKEKA